MGRRLVIVLVLVAVALFFCVVLTNQDSKTNSAQLLYINEQPNPTVFSSNHVKLVVEKESPQNHKADSFTCKPLSDNRKINSSLDEQWYPSFRRQLDQSNDFASQFTNALLSELGGKREEITLWNDLLKKFPSEALASYQLLNLCSGIIEHPACSDSNLDKLLKLNRVNKFNGAIWDQIAGLRLEKTDKEGAILAMRKAYEAPLYNQYHAERLGLTLEAVENIQGESIGADLMVWIFGLYNSAHHPSFTIQKFCEVESEINVEVADVCLNLGKMIEVNSYSYVSILRGLLIQQVTYLAINDEDGLTELNKRREAVSQQIKESHAGDNLILTNNTIRANWLKSYIDSGELEAANYLVEEARLHCLLPEKPVEIDAF